MENIKWYDIWWEEEPTWYNDEGELYEDYIWVRAMDKYPNEDEEVYIMFEDGKVKTAVYDGYDFGEYNKDNITAWGRKEENNE